jgi:outer membrane protein TolC
MRALVFAVFCVVFAPLGLSAPTLTLDYDKLRTYIEKNNRSYLASLGGVSSARARVGNLAQSFYPNSSLEAGIAEQREANNSGNTAPFWRFSIESNIYRGGRDQALQGTRDATVLEREMDAQIVLREELYKARALYIQLIGNGEIQRHLKVSLEDYVPLRSSLSKKVRAGLQTSTELLSLEVFSDDIQRELRRLEGEKHELEDELLLILGFEHGSQVQLSPFPRYLQLAEPMPQEARHPDPEIRRLEMQAATARREAGIIHDWWVPELDLFAAYTGYNIAKSDAMLSLPRQQMMVGLRVSLDLESKSILRGEIASKLGNAMALDHQKEGIRAALDHKIQRFRHESNTNQTLLQSYEKGLKKGEALLKRLRGEFEQGIVSSGELAAGVHSFHLLKRRYIETTIQIGLTQAGIETFFPGSSTFNKTTM